MTTEKTKKVEETAEHIITKCPKFRSIRKEKMGDYYISTGDIGRQQTCLNTVEIIISFDILSKPIKLRKAFLTNRKLGEYENKNQYWRQ